MDTLKYISEMFVATVNLVSKFIEMRKAPRENAEPVNHES